MNSLSSTLKGQFSIGWEKLLLLVKISRLLGWISSPGIVAIGIVYGKASLYRPQALALLAIFSFPFAFWMHGWNDIYDQESDRLNPRKDSWIYGGVIRPETEIFVRSALAICPIIPILVAVLMRFSLGTFTLIVVAYLLALIYSAPPVRLKARPIWEGYWSAAILWTLFATGFSLNTPIRMIPPETYFCLPAFIGLHLYSTVLDEQSDKVAHHRTIAARFGKRFTFLISTFYVLLSLISIPFLRYAMPVKALIIVSFFVLATSALFSEKLRYKTYKRCVLALLAFNALCMFALIVSEA